jgi:hypothetical protein
LQAKRSNPCPLLLPKGKFKYNRRLPRRFAPRNDSMIDFVLNKTLEYESRKKG